MAAIHGPGSGAEGPSVAGAVTGRVVGSGNHTRQAAYYTQQAGNPGKHIRRNVHVADALISKGPADWLDLGSNATKAALASVSGGRPVHRTPGHPGSSQNYKLSM